jgi:hypothetical protein
MKELLVRNKKRLMKELLARDKKRLRKELQPTSREFSKG